MMLSPLNAVPTRPDKPYSTQTTNDYAESMSSYTLKYAATRGEIWRWYWRAWARPAGLWRRHVALGAVATVGAASAHGFSRWVWLPAAVIGLAAMVCGLFLSSLWPQIRFKPQVRTLELDELGYRTSIGLINGVRRWSEIRSVRAEGDTVVITTLKGSAMLIPRRAFGVGTDRQQFVIDVEAWHRRATS